MLSLNIALANSVEAELEEALQRKKELLRHLKAKGGRLSSEEMEEVLTELDRIQQKFGFFGERIFHMAKKMAQQEFHATQTQVVH